MSILDGQCVYPMWFADSYQKCEEVAQETCYNRPGVAPKTEQVITNKQTNKQTKKNKNKNKQTNKQETWYNRPGLAPKRERVITFLLIHLAWLFSKKITYLTKCWKHANNTHYMYI